MPTRSPSRLDRVCPQWHFREAHRITLDARGDVVMAAVREVTWDEARLARTLRRLGRTPIVGDHRIVDDIHHAAGEAFMEAADDEIVFGGISTLTAPLRLDGLTAGSSRNSMSRATRNPR